VNTDWAHDLLARRPEWLRGQGPESDVVLSSRVRLARNLAGLPFSSVATRDDRELVLTRVEARLEAIKMGESTLWVDLRRSDAGNGRLLVERQMISAALLAGRRRTAAGREEREHDPRGVAASLPDERVAVMINEEDHIRIQSLRTGFDLGEALRAADEMDDALEEHLDYAFHSRLGYLTACPTNVGTGARFSVMLHLPGLALTGDLEKAKRAAHDMGLAVRGFYGEGTESSGDFFQISNQTTLGRSEGMLLDELARDIVPQIIEYERSSRRKLLDSQRILLEDRVYRALGVGQSARMVSSEEAMSLLSRLRLGILMGLLSEVSLDTVHSLMLLIQPAHLELLQGSSMDQTGRRAARANLLRERLR
jgi:protein arginine kinase